MTGANSQMSRMWWLAAPALVLALSTWCQLHGRALGVEPASFDVSLPWALRSAAGWVVAGALLAWFGDRLMESGFGRAHPWRVRLGLALALPVITLGSEVLLLSGETPLGLWLYMRLPLHLPFGVLLFAGYLRIRARHRRSEPVAVEKRAAPEAVRPLPQPAPTVEVMTGTGRTVVLIDDIECLEADRNYINVHTSQRSYLLRQTLTSLEKSLRADLFLRVHRSVIVNRAKIRERRSGGVLVLNSGRTVRVSRAFADRVH